MHNRLKTKQQSGGYVKIVAALLMAAGIGLGTTSWAGAVEFKSTGEWFFGTGIMSSTFITRQNGKHTQAATDDRFAAQQRLRIWIEAAASENLSGTLNFEIGDTPWGSAKDFAGGGALGTDATNIKVRRAYMDWAMPNTALKVRMGIQGMMFPNSAGGSSVLDADAVGIVANYTFSDQVGLTGVWVRPYNDNFVDAKGTSGLSDNADIFMLSLPVTLDSTKMTPWVSLGFKGRNYFLGDSPSSNNKGGDMYVNTIPYTLLRGEINGNASNYHGGSQPYSTLFFAGLPISTTFAEDWKLELDVNYGYSQSMGKYDITDFQRHETRRADTKREGWLAKALVEYKMDWGAPGLLGWYSSGDDGNVKNGSERMPAIGPCNNFTSFIGDDYVAGLLLSGRNQSYDLMMSYAGTWGLGIQLRNIVSFTDNLRHTFRAVYFGGTNNPGMIKYLTSLDSGESTVRYLTTNDYMLEFNLDSVWKIYDNLDLVVELGYIVNGTDQGAWNRSYRNDDSYQKGNGFKIAAVAKYTF